MEEDEEPPSLHDLLLDTAVDRRLPDFDLTTPSATAYLAHLVSLPLSSLSKEPSQISNEASTVDAELVNLSYREYSTFIAVHKCSAAVESAFGDFETSLELLIGSVPVLEEECRLFSTRTHGIETVRNKAKLLHEHQDKVTDLLELSHLMETCVRNGYYQEAMELASHAKALETRYPEVKLVTDMAKEIDAVMQLLFSQLLALLREPVKLPTLIKAITFLRRSGCMDDESLGMVFLTSRLHNFRQQLIQIERDRAEPVRYLRKYIDLFREHVYDIISQFTALFENPALLVSFTSQCVTDLIRLVEAYIPRISNDSAALSSVLVQLGYCSISFSRVGLDFAPLITAPFTHTVVSTYSYAVAAAAEQLSGTLKSALKSSSAPTDSIVDQGARSNALESISTGPQIDDEPPPVSNLPPLARFLNDHLTALNALRLLAPFDILPQLTHHQTESLLAATTAILHFAQQAASTPETSNGDRPKHVRTPSSPRAHLLRRNTETQLSPGLRAIRRKETQKICVQIADAWRLLVIFLCKALRENIFEERAGNLDPQLQLSLAELASWTELNRERETNGDKDISHVTSYQTAASNIHEEPEGMDASEQRVASEVSHDRATRPTDKSSLSLSTVKDDHPPSHSGEFTQPEEQDSEHAISAEIIPTTTAPPQSSEAGQMHNPDAIVNGSDHDPSPPDGKSLPRLDDGDSIGRGSNGSPGRRDSLLPLIRSTGAMETLQRDIRTDLKTAPTSTVDAEVISPRALETSLNHAELIAPMFSAPIGIGTISEEKPVEQVVPENLDIDSPSIPSQGDELDVQRPSPSTNSNIPIHPIQSTGLGEQSAGAEGTSGDQPSLRNDDIDGKPRSIQASREASPSPPTAQSPADHDDDARVATGSQTPATEPDDSASQNTAPTSVPATKTPPVVSSGDGGKKKKKKKKK